MALRRRLQKLGSEAAVIATKADVYSKVDKLQYVFGVLIGDPSYLEAQLYDTGVIKDGVWLSLIRY